MAALPEIDLASPLQFVINAAAGSSDARAKREVVEAALRAGGRRGDLLFCSPTDLTCMSRQAATRAIATQTAVVAVGGDGTLNTVAQAALAAGCAMGVVPQGTFNYFARTHGIPADPADAVRQLLHSVPAPVQVAGINERVFLVNVTAVSSRVRDGMPNSVNLLRWGADAAPGCCRIEQRDYTADDRVFRLAKVSEFRPDRR